MKPKERRESEEGAAAGTGDGDKRESEGELEMTTDISAMISPENERVTLGKVKYIIISFEKILYIPVACSP